MTERLAQGALCGIAAGAVTGIAARVAMHMVADGVPDGIGQQPDFTLVGSVVIVFIGAIAGMPIGSLFSWIDESIPGPRKARGVAFGLLLLLLIGPLFFLGARDEFITTQRVILFSLLFPIYGVSAGLALPKSRELTRHLPLPAQRALALATLVCGAAIAVLLAGSISTAIQLHGGLALALALPWLALLVWRSGGLRNRLATLTTAR